MCMNKICSNISSISGDVRYITYIVRPVMISTGLPLFLFLEKKGVAGIEDV